MIGHRLKPNFQIVCKGLGFLRVREGAILPGVTRGRWSRNSYYSLGHPQQLLVFGIEGFKCSAPLVVYLLVEPAGHRPLQSVDLGFQSEAPGDLPLLPQPVFRLYHPECRPLWKAVGRHAGYAREMTLPEPSEWRQRSSQLMCRFPSRAVPERTELILPTEFGSWPSQCA